MVDDHGFRAPTSENFRPPAGALTGQHDGQREDREAAGEEGDVRQGHALTASKLSGRSFIRFDRASSRSGTRHG